jgi:ribosome modulation factor
MFPDHSHVTFWQGYEAAVCGAARERCPFMSRAMRTAWLAGFDAAQK